MREEKVYQVLQDRPLDEKIQAPNGQQIFSILLKEEYKLSAVYIQPHLILNM